MVDPDRLDPDEHLSRTRLGVGNLLDPEHLRPAGLVNDDSTHDRQRTPERPVLLAPVRGSCRETFDER